MPGGNAPTNRIFRGRLARNTLLILLLLTLVPLLVLGSAAYLRTRGLLRGQIYSLLTTVSQVQGDRISREVTTGRQLLARAVVDADINQSMHAALEIDDRSSSEYVEARNLFFDQLQVVNQPKPYFSQFLVINAEGIIQLSTNRNWEGLKPTNLSGTASRNKQAESRFVYGLNPLYEKNLVLLTTIPYLNPAGEVIATIIGISEPNVIRDLMDRAVFFTKNSYIVPDKDVFIGINPYPDSFEKLIPYDPSQDLLFYIEYLNSQSTQSGVNELVSFQNEPVIAAYTWLPDLQTGWLTEIPQASVYQQLNSLLVFLGILLGITSLILVGSVFLVTQFLVNPLTKLAASVSQFSSGNWDVRTDIKREDEVGQLANSFNQMASDLSVLYQSLEKKVEERTRQLQTSGELSQLSVTASDLDELLSETVNLLAKRFGYPFAAIYLLDENNEFAVMRQIAAPPELIASLRGARIKVEPLSLVGWVAMTSSTKIDLIGQGAFGAIDREDLSPEARAEAGIPIIHAGKILGVLVVQSIRATQLNEDTIHELQILANQISPALQNFYLLEATQIDLQETNLLYKASHQIAQAENIEQIYSQAEEALNHTAYRSAFIVSNDKHFDCKWNNLEGTSQLSGIVRMDPKLVNQYLPESGPFFYQTNQKQLSLPLELVEWLKSLGRSAIALLPVRRGGELQNILILGTAESDPRAGMRFSSLRLQPYINLIELMTNTVEKIEALGVTQKRLGEMEILNHLSREIAQQTNVEALFNIIHRNVTDIFGNVDFLIARYDPDAHQIQIPYAYEEGQRLQVPPILFGQGLTSLVIRSRKSLRLVSPDDWRTLPPGSVAIFGKDAVSWLGAPMIVGGEVIGVLVVQDVHQSLRFSQEDEIFFSTLANQVAVIIRNTILLESTRQRAYTESLLNEITGNIRRSMSIQEILATTTTELGRALRVRKAKIALRPPQTSDNDLPASHNNGNNGHQANQGKSGVNGDLIHGE